MKKMTPVASLENLEHAEHKYDFNEGKADFGLNPYLIFMITLDDYYQGRKQEYYSQWTFSIEQNATVLLQRVNTLLDMYPVKQEWKVNSGWRPPTLNASIKTAARKSRHMTGEAIDINDDEGLLDNWCMLHLDSLKLVGLWMEHPSATKGWCHLQSQPPASGNRVFYP